MSRQNYQQLPKLDMTYLDQLRQKRQKIDSRMKQRETEQDKSLKLFLSHVQKQLEMLITDRNLIDDRNEQFQQQMRRHGQNFRKGMAQVIESSQKLKQAKQKYLLFMRQNHKPAR